MSRTKRNEIIYVHVDLERVHFKENSYRKKTKNEGMMKALACEVLLVFCSSSNNRKTTMVCYKVLKGGS